MSSEFLSVSSERAHVGKNIIFVRRLRTINIRLVALKDLSKNLTNDEWAGKLVEKKPRCG